jgi:tRNA(Ile)-lysidine synthase
MPALAAEFNPNLEGVLSGTAEIAADEEDYWLQQVEPLYRSIVRKSGLGLILPVKALLSNHLAVQRRLVRSGISELRGDLRSIDQQHVQAIIDICRSEHGHDRIIIPGVDAIRSFAFLLLAKPGELNSETRNYSIDLTSDGAVQLPYGAGIIELSALNSDQPICVNVKKESQFPKEVADLDLEVLSASGGRLQVRNWRPGDEILRPGHRTAEKIKSLFQESRVLLWKRRHWPVAVVNDEVIWARNFGAASQYSPKPGTKRIARLSYWPSDEFGEL